MKKPIILTILDGYGLREETHGNAVKLADNKVFESLWEKYPHTKLEASGQLVGLPKGQMGNSEVGHMNIGAGRIVYQPLELINKSIEEGTFYENKELNSIIDHVEANSSSLHIMGLLSDGGVHSHINHLFAIIDLCKKRGVKKVFYHVFMDGRDTLPNLQEKYLQQLQEKIESTNVGVIATVSGRYYAMDRDNNWDRIKLAYDAIVEAKGPKYANYQELVKHNKENNITDEFIVPSIIANPYIDVDEGEGKIKDNDGIIVFNYRPDRIRELFYALSNPSFDSFECKKINNLKLVTMMKVSDDVITTNAFKIEKIENSLGEYISKLKKNQLRIAETEKYAHVTYFFDGGVEKELEGCKRTLINSPKVATYDLKPNMSAIEVTDALLKDIENYDLVILNFANGDMVGHTGVLEAAINAVETVDKCLARIYEKIKELDGIMIITADHGNCEEMLDENNNVLTAHTTNPVPFIVTKENIKLHAGKLGDIAPTILELMNLEKPVEMTGESLIEK